jgi:chromosomal replication initiation ATPase DnaA
MLVKEPEDYPVAMRQQSRAATDHMAQTLFAPCIENLKREITKRDIIINELTARLSELKLDLVSNEPLAGRRIATEIARQHGFTFRQLISPRRNQKLAYARHHAMYELDRRTSLSLPQIGKLLGGRDHTTVLHGIRAHAARNPNA